MRRKRRLYKPRFVDRAVFCIMGILHLTSGAYLAGPWYLDSWRDSGSAPLLEALNSPHAVDAYGALMIVNAAFLLYAATGASGNRYYQSLISWTLLSGFSIRLFLLIGVLLATDIWRPPSYLSQTATVFILGAYWVWVKGKTRAIRTTRQ